MKLYHQLGEMTYAVDRINGVRLALQERAKRLPAGDALTSKLQSASRIADEPPTGREEMKKRRVREPS